MRKAERDDRDNDPEAGASQRTPELWDLAGYPPPSLCRALAVQLYATELAFHVGSGDLNLDIHACKKKKSTFAHDPSLQ